MTKKIAAIASSIHLIKQRHLIEWYEAVQFKFDKVVLFVGSASSAPPRARVYRLESRLAKLRYFVRHFAKLSGVRRELLRFSPLLDYDPDLVHLLTAQTYARIKPVLGNLKVRLVVSFRGFDLNVFPYQSESNLTLIREIFQRADCLHFISDDLRRKAVFLGADVNKTVVIRRSFDVDVRSELVLDERVHSDTSLIVTVGRLVWEKGYIYALKALSLLKARGYRFSYAIVGEGIDRDMLVHHIKRFGLEDEVRLLGELDRDSVFKLLSKASIYLQPSISEGLCNAVMEASFYKVPVVAFATGGIPEVVLDGETGLLCETYDYVELAGTIQRMLDSPELRMKFGNAGRGHILENFSRKNEVEQWLDLYSQV